jgi:dihydroxyacid dehydratase/phosphogluconate dehydratase
VLAVKVTGGGSTNAALHLSIDPTLLT